MNKTQLIVIVSAIALFVLLIFANTKLPPNKELEQSEHSTPNSLELKQIVENARVSLSAEKKAGIEKLEKILESSSDKKSAFENIINQWDSLRQPVVAAYYVEQAALTSPNEKNWLESGNRYYYSVRFAKENERQVIYNKAIQSFDKVLEINPKNVDAKINMAACYVEGSNEPMKGITMLREVEKTDSNNVNLQLNFAFFSEKSGQWDKAIKRFDKVLQIKPDFTEAYLHLADAYEQKGDNTKAIECLEKYNSLIDDLTIKTEIRSYIDKLKMKS